MADDLDDLDKLLADVEDLQAKQSAQKATAVENKDGDDDETEKTESSPPSSAASSPRSTDSETGKAQQEEKKLEKQDSWSTSSPSSAGDDEDGDTEAAGDNNALLDRLNAVQAQGAEMNAFLKDEDSLDEADETIDLGVAGSPTKEDSVNKDVSAGNLEVSQEQYAVSGTAGKPAADTDSDDLLKEVDNLEKRQQDEIAADCDDGDEYGDDFEASEPDSKPDDDCKGKTEIDHTSPTEESSARQDDENQQAEDASTPKSNDEAVSQPVAQSEPDELSHLSLMRFVDKPAKPAAAAQKEQDQADDHTEEQEGNNDEDDEENMAGNEDDGEEYEDERFEEDGGGYDDEGFENDGAEEEEEGGPDQLEVASNSQFDDRDPVSLTVIVALENFQKDWMKEGSRQKRIYQYAVRELAQSLVFEILDGAIEQADEQLMKEETLAATVLKEQFVGYKQPRECDYVREEKKRKQMEAQRKLDAERNKREEEEKKRLKDRLKKEKEMAATKDSQLSESLVRVKEKRKEEKDKLETIKEKEVQAQRERIERNRRRAEQKRKELQEFIQMKKEEEQRQIFEEEKEKMSREVLRSVQQESAYQSMEEYVFKKRALQAKAAQRQKQEWSQIRNAHNQFEDSLRQCDERVLSMKKPRAEKRSNKSDGYSKQLPPRHPSAEIRGASFADSVQFSVSAYCSPSNDGSIHPTARKRVKEMLNRPEHKTRTFTPHEAIVSLQQAFVRFDKWRSGQVVSSDLCSALQRMGVDVGREYMERIVTEFGVEEADILSEEDFVEVGLSVISVAAPYQLAHDKAGPRSKSAEPKRGHSPAGLLPELNPGERERLTMSAMDMRKEDLDFPEQGLKAHLTHAVKGQRARERELALLREEALQIQTLRQKTANRQQTAKTAATPSPAPDTECAAKDAGRTAQSEAAPVGGAERAPGGEAGEGMEKEEEKEPVQAVATWGAEEAAPAFGGPSAAKPSASSTSSASSKPLAAKPSKNNPFAFRKAGGAAAPAPAAPAATQPPAPSSATDPAKADEIGAAPAALAPRVSAGGAAGSASTAAHPAPGAAQVEVGLGGAGESRRRSSGGGQQRAVTPSQQQRAPTPGSRPLTRQDSSRPSSRQTPFHGDLETETLDKTSAPPAAEPAPESSGYDPLGSAAAPAGGRASKPFKFKMPGGAAPGRRAPPDEEAAQPRPAGAAGGPGLPPRHAAPSPAAHAPPQSEPPLPDLADPSGSGSAQAPESGVGGAAGSSGEAPKVGTPPGEMPLASRPVLPARPKGRNRPF